MYNRLIELADRDHNSFVSLEEQIEAWRKMGKLGNGIIIESGGETQFREPSAEELRKGIASYEEENKSRN